MQYLTPQQFADRHGVTRQRVMQWLADGRIPGAEPITGPDGRVLAWTIPAKAKPPKKLTGGRKKT